MIRAKVAAAAAAFVGLVVGVGAGAYEVVSDDRPPPPSSTTSTTSTTRAPTGDEIAEIIAGALSEDLDVALAGTEARCVADGLLGRVGLARLQAMAEGSVESLTEDEQMALVRTVVQCLPPEKAAALLGSASTTTVVVRLPDEGTDP